MKIIKKVLTHLIKRATIMCNEGYYIYPVCVYPTGEQYNEPPEYMSDDYEERYTTLCHTCDSELELHYQEPLASCSCGTQEWFL